MNLENHMVVNFDEHNNENVYGSGTCDRCTNCGEVILIEHVWEDKIVCSFCYWHFRELAEEREYQKKI